MDLLRLIFLFAILVIDLASHGGWPNVCGLWGNVYRDSHDLAQIG